MPDFATVRFAVAEHIATITLNRPERLNAMNQQMKDDLRAAWNLVKEDPEIWCVIVTGEGRAFSSGADVETLDSRGFKKIDRWHQLAMIETIRAMPTPRRMGVVKPVIAAVNGLVNGVTLDLVTEADIPIASEKAQFFDSHVSLGYVSSHEMVNMARRIPLAVTLRMALLGAKERMSAERAREVGLVTEVVPRDELLERAAWAARVIADSPALVIQGTMRALWTALELSRSQAVGVANLFTQIGSDAAAFQAGQDRFASGQRVEWRLR